MKNIYLLKILLPLLIITFLNDVLAQNNVGIGVPLPQEKLDIAGAIKIGTDKNDNSNAPIGGAGTLRFKGGQFEGWNGSVWVSLAGGSGDAPFKVDSNAVKSNPSLVNVATDDFLFGSTNIEQQSNPDYHSRFFFDKSKGAFRTGLVTGDQWNEFKIGNQSFAAGYDVTASGSYSVALGQKSRATGINAIAMGKKAYAYGDYSFAWGNKAQATAHGAVAFGGNNFATNDYSNAFGVNNTASGKYSVAVGSSVQALEDYSFAGGYQSIATGESSIAFGKNANANADESFAIGANVTASGNSSLAIGSSSTATKYRSIAAGFDAKAEGSSSMAIGHDVSTFGDKSISIGHRTDAHSAYEHVIGRYNTTYTPSSTTYWEPLDRLFTIGNGTSSFNRSDALTILKNGNVGIGTSTPSSTLHLIGTFKFEDGNQGAGKVLTSDANGNVSWQVANSGTDDQGLTGATLTGTTLQIDIEDGTSTSVDLLSLVNDADADASNEIQTLNLTGNTLTISGSNDVDLSGYVSSDDQGLTGATLTGTTLQIDIEDGASTSVDLLSLVDDADADVSNELQTLSQTGTDVTLSNGGGSISVADNDNDSTNEYNTGVALIGTELQIIDGGGSQTIDLVSLANSPFEVKNNLVQPDTSKVSLGADDFIFGSTNLEDNTDTAHDARFFFDKSKGAFRAGLVTGDQWNEYKRGNQSFAAGYDVTASGSYAVALGEKSRATGINAIAMGRKAYAFGNYSFAWGNKAQATGHGAVAFGGNNFATNDYSYAFGVNNNASGVNSVAVGSEVQAVGDYSFAGGYQSVSNGEGSFALGENATTNADISFAIGSYVTTSGEEALAVGKNSSASSYRSMAIGFEANTSGEEALAFGHQVTATGESSMAIGNSVEAHSAFENVFGRYNTNYTPLDTISWNTSDRLFSIGNGTSDFNRSDAFTILKNGNVGIGTSTPSNTLHLVGTLRYEDGNQGAGKVLTSDANGNVSWQVANSGTDDQGLTGATLTGTTLQIDIEDGTSTSVNLLSLVDDADSDSTNELQTLNLTGNTLSLSGDTTTIDLSNYVSSDDQGLTGATLTGTSLQIDIEDGASTSVDLLSLVNDADADTSNELQTLSQVGTDVTLSNGGGTISVADNDNDATNEIQSLSLTGNTLAISGRNDVDLSGYVSSDDQGLTGATLTGTTLQIDIEDGASTSVDLSSLANGPFKVINNLVQPDTTQVDMSTDDFIFGSSTLNDNSNLDNDTRFFFDKSKGAFRTGSVTGDQWDEFKRGNQSFAAGYDVTASGSYSLAFGEKSRATGIGAIALGRKAYAYGDRSFAWGNKAEASALGAVAFGVNTNAMADFSFAAGANATASGEYSVAVGKNANASNDASFAIGNNVTASGNSSLAIGSKSEASGYKSIAAGFNVGAEGIESMAIGHDVFTFGDKSISIGHSTDAHSAYEHVIGRYNTTYTPISATNWEPLDRLFTIGNGTSDSTRSDALTILKNGNVGIGSSMPSATLHIDGTMRYVDGNQQAGYILVSDTNGTMSWINPTSISTAADADTNSTNELQTLSQSGTDVTLSNGGGNISVADNDDDASNEFQNLSSSSSGTNRTINISDGTGTIISVEDNDNDSSNEIQTLSVSGSDVTLSNGGGTVTVNDGDWAFNGNHIHNDNSGSVGIGTSSPDTKLHISSNSSGENTGIKLTQGSYNSLIYHNNSGDLVIRKAINTDQLVIDEAGGIGIGTAAPNSKFHVIDNFTNASDFVATIENTANGAYANGLKIKAGENSTSANNRFISFRRPDGNEVGAVRQTTSSSVDFWSPSDARLKTNIQNTNLGLEELMLLEVKDYVYKDDIEKPQTGFIAQEVYNIFPNAVSKGGEDVKNNPWMMNYGKLTPLIVKAVQEIEAEKNAQIDELQEQITALQQQNKEILQALKSFQNK